MIFFSTLQTYFKAFVEFPVVFGLVILIYTYGFDPYQIGMAVSIMSTEQLLTYQNLMGILFLIFQLYLSLAFKTPDGQGVSSPEL